MLSTVGGAVFRMQDQDSECGTWDLGVMIQNVGFAICDFVIRALVFKFAPGYPQWAELRKPSRLHTELPRLLR